MNLIKQTPLKVLMTVLVLSATQACVSSSSYDELEVKYQASQNELELTRSHLNEAKHLLAKTNSMRRHELDRANALSKELAKTRDREGSYLEKIQSIESEKKSLEGSLQTAQLVVERARQVTLQRDRILKAYLDKLRSVFSSQDFDIEVIGGRLLLRLPSDILFASGSAQLSANGLSTIRGVASILASDSQNQFQIEGHTDSDPINGGTYKTNWHLGYARAMSVLNEFVSKGVHGSLISAASFGEYRPRSHNVSEEGKQRNRRIEIVMIPDLSALTDGLRQASID